MKNTNRLILMVTFLLCSIVGFSQTEKATLLETQLCQEWTIKHYQMMGKVVPLPREEKGDKMKFHPNYTLVAVASGEEASGKWKYNVTSETLFITPDPTKKTAAFKIIKITEKELVLETKGPNGAPLQIHLSNQEK